MNDSDNCTCDYSYTCKNCQAAIDVRHAQYKIDNMAEKFDALVNEVESLTRQNKSLLKRIEKLEKDASKRDNYHNN